MRLRRDLGRGPAPRAQVRREAVEALLIDVKVEEADSGRRPHAQDVRSAIREGKLHVINIPILQRLVADVEVASLEALSTSKPPPSIPFLPGW